MNNKDKIKLLKENNKIRNELYKLGICPIMGPTGPRGPVGPVGPIRNFVVGMVNEGDFADVTIEENGMDEIINFTLPKGPKGDDGPNKIKASYLVTFNDNVDYTGTLINSLERIPIGRKELDIDNLINLNTNDNTMSFNLIGYYKITFIVNARILTNDNFNPDNDFISLGLRLIDTDNVYIGAGKWIYNNEYNTITGQGILAVNDTNNIYELVNLSKEKVYLNTPDIINIKSISYFTNPLVNVIIEFLGK